MALFVWNDDYSVKVPSIDEQHKRLVGMLNELHEGMVSGSGRERLEALLVGLVEYTTVHFQHEEDLFARFEYPESEAHTKEHQLLVARVLEFKKKYDRGEARINMELMVFLKDWLIRHILGSDKSYSAHLVERGAL